MIFTGLTVTFLKQLWIGLRLTSPVLLTLMGAILFLGQIVRSKRGLVTV